MTMQLGPRRVTLSCTGQIAAHLTRYGDQKAGESSVLKLYHPFPDQDHVGTIRWWPDGCTRVSWLGAGHRGCAALELTVHPAVIDGGGLRTAARLLASLGCYAIINDAGLDAEPVLEQLGRVLDAANGE